MDNELCMLLHQNSLLILCQYHKDKNLQVCQGIYNAQVREAVVISSLWRLVVGGGLGLEWPVVPECGEH